MSLYIDFYSSSDPDVIAVDPSNCSASLDLTAAPQVVAVPLGMGCARLLGTEAFYLSIAGGAEELQQLDDDRPQIDILRSVQAGGYIIARAPV